MKMSVLFQHTQVTQSSCKQEIFLRKEKALLFACLPLNNRRERFFLLFPYAKAERMRKDIEETLLSTSKVDTAPKNL